MTTAATPSSSAAAAAATIGPLLPMLHYLIYGLSGQRRLECVTGTGTDTDTVTDTD